MFIYREKHSFMKRMTFEENCKKLPGAEIHAMATYTCSDHFFPPDFFAEHTDCNKVIDMFALGVSPQYRRLGIGTELLNQSMKVR